MSEFGEGRFAFWGRIPVPRGLRLTTAVWVVKVVQHSEIANFEPLLFNWSLNEHI